MRGHGPRGLSVQSQESAPCLWCWLKLSVSRWCRLEARATRNINKMQKATPLAQKKQSRKSCAKKKGIRESLCRGFLGAVGSSGIVGEVNRPKTQRHAKWACQSVSQSLRLQTDHTDKNLLTSVLVKWIRLWFSFESKKVIHGMK